jgi:DNA-binding transcriptional LysR family regulator
MVAVPVTGDIRMTVVGSPTYLARRGTPRHPRDLVEHECLNWHPVPEAPAYRWEFTEAGREVVVAAPGRVLSTDSAVNIRLARDGLGLTIVYEDQVRDEIARGELVPVLSDFCEPFAGYSLFYPQRRHASPALRALIDHLRGAREAARGRQPGGRRPPREKPAGRSARPQGR